jgi:hypothetical protein
MILASSSSTVMQDYYLWFNLFELIFMLAVWGVLPLYGAYRWGLAEFRASTGAQNLQPEPHAEVSSADVPPFAT